MGRMWFRGRGVDWVLLAVAVFACLVNLARAALTWEYPPLLTAGVWTAMALAQVRILRLTRKG